MIGQDVVAQKRLRSAITWLRMGLITAGCGNNYNKRERISTVCAIAKYSVFPAQ
jgi:hypothetical protein